MRTEDEAVCAGTVYKATHTLGGDVESAVVTEPRGEGHSRCARTASATTT